MHDNGGIKKNGRFLKKDSKTLKNVQITEFSFAEICEADVVIPDNPNLNIIHQKLHFQDELDAIKSSDIDNKLVDPKNKMPIMSLRDFTQDWVDHKNKLKNRKNKNVDDDEDLESIFNEKNNTSETNEESIYEEEKKIINPDQPLTSQGDSQDPIDINQSFDEHPQQEIAPEQFSQHEETMSQHLDNSHATQQEQEQEQLQSQIEYENQLAADEVSDQSFDQNHQSSVDFVPMEAPQQKPDEVAAVEQSAIDEYQRQKEIQSIDIESIKEEAKAVGYEDGFRTGEERATIEAQQKSQEMFSKVAELMNEFQNLKTEILDNVQSNFQEIAVAMCEAIMERSVSLDPNIFANIMQRAISESVDEEHFKILVNPDMANQLKNLNIMDISNRIQSSNEIESGDFKIETSLGTVNSGIKKIINDLMEEADLQLFENDHETDKAG